MSDKEPDKGSTPTRRSILRKTAGIGAASLALSQSVAAGSDDTNDDSESESMTRAEKAAQEGEEWNEAWINEDEIGEDNTYEASPNLVIAPPPGGSDGRREFGDTISVGGVEFTFEGYVGICEAEIHISALGQSTTKTFSDCSKICDNSHFDAAAAYIDWTTCYTTDGEIIIDAEGCVWQVSSWDCGTTDITITP